MAQPVTNPPQCRRPESNPWVAKILWRRAWQPTPIFLPGEFYEERSLEGYSLWGHKELDTSDLACTHTSISKRTEIGQKKMNAIQFFYGLSKNIYAKRAI